MKKWLAIIQFSPAAIAILCALLQPFQIQNLGSTEMWILLVSPLIFGAGVMLLAEKWNAGDTVARGMLTVATTYLGFGLILRMQCERCDVQTSTLYLVGFGLLLISPFVFYGLRLLYRQRQAKPKV